MQPQGLDSYESKRNAVRVLSAGSPVGMRIVLLVDRFAVQQMYRPLATTLDLDPAVPEFQETCPREACVSAAMASLGNLCGSC